MRPRHHGGAHHLRARRGRRRWKRRQQRGRGSGGRPQPLIGVQGSTDDTRRHRHVRSAPENRCSKGAICGPWRSRAPTRFVTRPTRLRPPMARPGLEPGTPRFSGRDGIGSFLQKIPVNGRVRFRPARGRWYADCIGLRAVLGTGRRVTGQWIWDPREARGWTDWPKVCAAGLGAFTAAPPASRRPGARRRSRPRGSRPRGRSPRRSRRR